MSGNNRGNCRVTQKRYFCTYFDINYLPRALCLLDSLERHCPSFVIYMLCLDDEVLAKIKDLQKQHVIAISLKELELAVPELIRLKAERTIIEYYFTCGPAYIQHVVNCDTKIDIITYLDADLYFYSDPEPLFDLFEGYSVGVVGHHLPEFRKEVRQGLYNVGWINFRRDKDGMACLARWKVQCLEWCFDRHEDGKYADQLYLDKWPQEYQGFYEFTHHGANVAAWNVGDFKFSVRNGSVFVDNDPLIFYHFHGFKKVARNIYNSALWLYFKPPHPVLKKYVFEEYISKLEQYSTDRDPTYSIRNYQSKNHYLKLVVQCAIGIIFRQYLIVIHGRVF